MSDQGESQSIRDRIGAVLSPPQEQAPEPEQVAPEQPQAEEVAAEAPEVPEQEVQETAPDPTADWVEVELEGDKIVIPPKFRDAFLKNADYTQKTQLLADQKRLTEQRAQALQLQEQTLQQLTPLLVQGQLIESTLQQYQRIDWEALRANDVVDYSTKRADYAALMQQKQELQQQFAQGKSYLEQQRQAALAEAAKAAEPVIRKAIPDWGPEKDAKLTQFALKNGATADELRGLAVRPWAVVLLDMALKYQDLQAKKAELPKQVKHLSPVAKPGAKSTVQTTEQASYRKAQEQLRKSGGKDPGALRALIRAKLAQ